MENRKKKRDMKINSPPCLQAFLLFFLGKSIRNGLGVNEMRKEMTKEEAKNLIASILIKKGKVECFVEVSLSSIVRESVKEKNESFDLYKESKFSISIRSHIKWKKKPSVFNRGTDEMTKKEWNNTVPENGAEIVVSQVCRSVDGEIEHVLRIRCENCKVLQM